MALPFNGLISLERQDRMRSNKDSISPLVIIGAGRSGTNIVRDTLVHLPGWETWDCDEINLIWRHGNIHHPHDIFGAELARPKVKKFIQGAFESFKKQSAADVVVEKTCANSMRVPFIKEVFPQARFLYITRDGRDVALSAAKRWTASVEMEYLLKKLKYVPKVDIPFYGIRFVKNRIHQARSQEKRQAIWGPVFPGMADWAKENALIDVCARQWAESVNEADKAFQDTPADQWHAIKYEDFVTNPKTVLAEVMQWYNPKLETPNFDVAVKDIHANSLYGWKRKQDKFSLRTLEILSPILERHNYAPSA